MWYARSLAARIDLSVRTVADPLAVHARQENAAGREEMARLDGRALVEAAEQCRAARESARELLGVLDKHGCV